MAGGGLATGSVLLRSQPLEVTIGDLPAPAATPFGISVRKGARGATVSMRALMSFASPFHGRRPTVAPDPSAAGALVDWPCEPATIARTCSVGAML